jgi:hypothetical protein
MQADSSKLITEYTYLDLELDGDKTWLEIIANLVSILIQ